MELFPLLSKGGTKNSQGSALLSRPDRCAAPGYMIVNFLVRQGMSVERALRIFAEHRPPGIYKEDYIRELYKYNHEPL